MATINFRYRGKRINIYTADLAGHQVFYGSVGRKYVGGFRSAGDAAEAAKRKVNEDKRAWKHLLVFLLCLALYYPADYATWRLATSSNPWVRTIGFVLYQPFLFVHAWFGAGNFGANGDQHYERESE